MDRDQAIKLMQDLLRRVTEKKASDLFITAGFPPAIKIDGEIRPQSERALTLEQSATLVRAIMNDRQTKEFDASKECNFAIAPEASAQVVSMTGNNPPSPIAAINAGCWSSDTTMIGPCCRDIGKSDSARVQLGRTMLI